MRNDLELEELRQELIDSAMELDCDEQEDDGDETVRAAARQQREASDSAE